MPYGLYAVGSRAGERRNLMTTNWASQVSFDPKLLGIGIEKPALTHELIAEGGVFSLHKGATGAPILDQAPAFVDCEVRQAVDLGGHTFSIGEVVDANFQADEETPVLRMEDTRLGYGG